ncbi:MAG TPA: permease [Candidatus Acidoferrum sp.]|nr:permease [Candidatus Acidoferrum sp.]
MGILKTAFGFFQNQVLGMKWLDGLVGRGLEAAGLDPASGLYGGLKFFIYDSAKITALLCLLVFAISYIQSFFPPERSKELIGRIRGLPANCLAALLGTVTPFCSCSSIPLFIGFSKAGLPIGVTFSFLISSPMVDLASLLLLTGVFGAKVALLYVALGLVVAVAGGTLIEKLHMERYIEDFTAPAGCGCGGDSGCGCDSDGDDGCGCDCDDGDSCGCGCNSDGDSRTTTRERVAYSKEQTVATFKQVFPYVLVGVGIGAVIHNWVPEAWVVSVLGAKNPFGVVIASVVGVPLYSDTFGVIAIAQALLYKGAQLGTVLAFMMGVTTLSLPSIVMLRQAVKPKLLALFVAICTGGIIAVGYFFNAIEAFLV